MVCNFFLVKMFCILDRSVKAHARQGLGRRSQRMAYVNLVMVQTYSFVITNEYHNEIHSLGFDPFPSFLSLSGQLSTAL